MGLWCSALSDYQTCYFLLLGMGSHVLGFSFCFFGGSCLDLTNGSFGLGFGRVKFRLGKVRVTESLFGLSSVWVKFGLIEFGFGLS